MIRQWPGMVMSGKSSPFLISVQADCFSCITRPQDRSKGTVWDDFTRESELNRGRRRSEHMWTEPPLDPSCKQYLLPT